MKPLVSILIPGYNAERWIGRYHSDLLSHRRGQGRRSLLLMMGHAIGRSQSLSNLPPGTLSVVRKKSGCVRSAKQSLCSFARETTFSGWTRRSSLAGQGREADGSGTAVSGQTHTLIFGLGVLYVSARRSGVFANITLVRFIASGMAFWEKWARTFICRLLHGWLVAN